MARQVFQALHVCGAGEQRPGIEGVVDLQRATEIEPLGDLPQVGDREVAAEHVADGSPDDVARDVVGAAQFAFVFQLELAGDRRQRRIDVGDARHDDGLAGQQRAPLGVRDDVLEQRDRQALADARSLVDLRVLPRLERDLLDDFADEVGNLDRASRRAAARLPAR